MPILEGRELGGCKLIRKLGAGGMGEVYLAEQSTLGNRLVAVKVVSPDDATFHPEVAEDLARRFKREAALLGQLSHPNILPVHDSGVSGSLLYLVMDYAPEGSLVDAIRGDAKHPLQLPLDLPFAINIISQIAAALQYTHEHNIVHRDVKPANVLVRIEPNGDWRMLLADFGIARGIEATTQRTQITGTFTYMAPEQFSGKFSPASDQYALAVMAFQLLAGRPPFEGDLATLTRAHMYEVPPSLHALNPAVPVAVDAVIARALAKEPVDRYPSVAEFATALRMAVGATDDIADASTAMASVPNSMARASATALSTEKPPVFDPGATASITEHTRRRSQPWRILVTLAVAVVLLAGVFGGALLIHGQQGLASTQPTQTAQPGATATPTSTSGATSVPVSTVTPLPTCAAGTLAQHNPPSDCAPTPPVAVGSAILAAPTPPCDNTSYGWQTSLNVTQQCSTNAGVALKATTTTSLGCLSATTVSSGDGYAEIQATPKSGAVVLAFRQSPDPSGKTTNVTGYYFALYPNKDGAYSTYSLYSIDASGQSHILLNSLTMPFTPNKTFILGAAYKGSHITPYVSNGSGMVALQSTSDTSFTQGWFGMCTGDEATFSNAEVYAAAQ